MTRPASMRPITGTDSTRKSRASASTALPERAARGRKASAVLGNKESDFGNIAEGALDRREQPLSERPNLLHRPGKQPQRRQALGKTVGIGVKPQHGLERRQPDLVEAKRPFQRVAREAPDQLGAAGDEPRLRAAQQLVAAERDEVRAPRQRLRYGRFVW